MNTFRRDYKQGGAQAEAQRTMFSDSLSYVSRSFDPCVARTQSDPPYSFYLAQQHQWDVAFDDLYFNSPSPASVGDMRGTLLQEYDAFPLPENPKTMADLNPMLRSSQFCHMRIPLGVQYYAEDYKELESVSSAGPSSATHLSSPSPHSSPEPRAAHASLSPEFEAMHKSIVLDPVEPSEYAPSVANGTDHEDERSPSPQHRTRAIPRLNLQSHAYAPKRQRAKFHCSTCGRGYSRRDRRDTCEDRHKEIKSYVCGGKCGTPDCQVSYSSLDCYRRHLWPSTKRQISCHICHKVTSRQNLARHRKRCF